MISRFTGYVSPNEWRWVIVVSSILILVAFLPFLWVILSTAGITSGGDTLQFMGGVHHHYDASAEISKIVQGAENNVLTKYLFTPEPHNSTFLESAIYIALGWVARVARIDPIVLFHVARVGASLFMYMSIYYFAAVIWSKIRTRRVFFTVAAVGSGLGWIATPLLQDASFIDIRGSMVFPFQSTLINVHIPFVIGSLCILTSAVIAALRPGHEENPAVTNSGLLVFVMSLVIALLYPQALIPMMMSFFTLILAHGLMRRNLLGRDLRWMLWFGVPALPIIVYYAIVLSYNPVLANIWLQMNEMPTVNPLHFFISLGIPFIIAIPGIYRAAWRFEPDGNQFMLGWLISMFVLIFLSPVVRLNFGVGLMIPIAYFAARAMEDVWFQLIPRTQRIRLFVLLIPFMILSHVYVLVMPLYPIMWGNHEDSGYFLPDDYMLAFRWIANQTNRDAIILASPQVSQWIPAWSGVRVVYGHPTQTLNPQEKRAAVIAWFSAQKTDDSLPQICDDVLNGSDTLAYRVRYVMVGPVELAHGRSACLEGLIPTVTFETVTIYRVTSRLDRQ